MKPPPFRYFAPETLDEALALLAEHGDEAKALAGGQSLIPLLNFRLARPAVLVDLNGIGELGGIAARDGGGVRIGAMTRQRAAERSAVLDEHAPLVAAALYHVAHPPIRNRGTIGGSIAHADAAAELPAIALALDMRMRVRSRARERWVDAGDFFLGFLTTVLEPDELLVELAVPPVPSDAGWAFDEVARRHGDYALLGVAAVVALDDAGACRHARLAYVNAAGTPVRAPNAERALLGRRPDADAVREAVELAAREIDPPTDVHASAAYRRQLARVLTERVLARAVQRVARPTAQRAELSLR